MLRIAWRGEGHLLRNAAAHRAPHHVNLVDGQFIEQFQHVARHLADRNRFVDLRASTGPSVIWGDDAKTIRKLQDRLVPSGVVTRKAMNHQDGRASSSVGQMDVISIPNADRSQLLCHHQPPFKNDYRDIVARDHENST
jgi:uncharacterized membrane-anchored protein